MATVHEIEQRLFSWAPRESRQRLMDIAVENLRAFLAGAPVNVVNP